MCPDGSADLANNPANCGWGANAPSATAKVTATGTTTGVALGDYLAQRLDIRSFGALGDGVNNDGAAIQAAHDALPAHGGIIFLPRPPVSYRFTSTITFTKPIILEGDGRCELTKASSLNGPGIVLAGPGITIRDLHVGGEGGNGGDGVVILHKNCSILNVQIYLQGRDGLRIGPDGVISVPDGAQAEQWYLERVTTSNNGRYGTYVHDAVNSPTEAQRGTSVLLLASDNTSDGLRLDSSTKCTFIGCNLEGNGGYGLNVGPGLGSALSVFHWIQGGSFSENASGAINVAANVRDLDLVIPSDASLTVNASAQRISQRTTSLTTAEGFVTKSVKTTAPNGSLVLQGNRDASSTSTDVTILSTVARTNGYVLNVALGADPYTSLLNVNYQGNVAANGLITSGGNPAGRKVAVPANASDAGTPGDFAADASYAYFCTDANAWKRVAIATW
jgi:hypothetical protein